MGLESFRDQRVFAVNNEYVDRHTAKLYGPDDIETGQTETGPTYIVVGSQVSDERLMRHAVAMNKRYGCTVQQLSEARNGNILRVR